MVLATLSDSKEYCWVNFSAWASEMVDVGLVVVFGGVSSFSGVFILGCLCFMTPWGLDLVALA